MTVDLDATDRVLLSHCRPKWRKVAMVVGQALNDENRPQVTGMNDLALAARVWALVDKGLLYEQGFRGEMHYSEVRLRADGHSTSAED